MASLLDTVSKRLVRKDGKLVEEATPVSQLAGQQGLTAPPLTPQGVLSLGGNANQAKMAGTPNQKQSALRQSTDQVNTIQEAEADKRYRASLSAAEQQKKQQAEGLTQVLGESKSKAQDLINKQIQALVPPSPAATTAPQLATAGLVIAADPTKQASVDSAFQAVTSLIASGADPKGIQVQQALLDLASVAGMTADDVDQLAAKAQESVGKQVLEQAGTAVASQLADASQVGVAALLPEVGSSVSELAQLLGIPEDQVASMSISDLDAAVEAVTRQGEELSAAETQAASQSALLGAAERAAMRERGRELSTSGSAAIDEQLNDLSRSMENADTVSLGGQSYTIEQLLDDDTISKVITDYLTNPDSESSKALAADPNAAGLLGFVNKYRDVLQSAATSMATAATEQQAISKENAELGTFGDIELPDELMTAIYGDSWGKPSASRLGQKGVVQAIGGLPKKIQSEVASVISSAVTRGVLDPADIAELNNKELSKLFLDKKGNLLPEGSRLIDSLLNPPISMGDVDRAYKAGKGGIDSLIDMYFKDLPGGGGRAGLESLVTGAAANRAAGYKTDKQTSRLLDIVDKDKDGRLDKGYEKSLYESIKSQVISADSISEILSGATPPSPVSMGGSSGSSRTPALDTIYRRIGEPKPGESTISLLTRVTQNLPEISWGSPVDPTYIEFLEASLSIPVIKSAGVNVPQHYELQQILRKRLAEQLVAAEEAGGDKAPSWAQDLIDSPKEKADKQRKEEEAKQQEAAAKKQEESEGIGLERDFGVTGKPSQQGRDRASKIIAEVRKDRKKLEYYKKWPNVYKAIVSALTWG